MSEREIVNATITNADIDIERVLTYWVTLDYGGSGQGFGGYGLGGPSRFTELAITRLLETVGVEKWSQLKGKPVRADRSWGKVYRIGHFLNDKWLDLEALAAECGLRGGANV